MSDDGGGKSGGGVRVGEKPGKSRPSEAPKPVVDRLPGGSGGDAPRKSKEGERKIEATQSHGRLTMRDDEEGASNPAIADQQPLDKNDTLCHTRVCEQGGMTMVELANAMKADANAQEQLATVIAEMLEETVSRNDGKGRKGGLYAFEGDKSPISASAYVKRIVKYAECSPCCLAIGVLYLERLKRRHKTLCLTSYNFQRLFLVAVMEAAKVFDDFYYSNQHWADVGGITLRELNSIELEFLFRINFFLSIDRNHYDAFVGQLLAVD